MNKLLALAESAFARTRDICTMGITDAADYLGLGRDKVAELFAAGTIATRMIGGRRKTSEAELERYAALTTEAPKPRKARKGELEKVMEKQMTRDWATELGTAKLNIFPNNFRAMISIQIAIGDERIVVEMSTRDFAYFLNQEPVDAKILRLREKQGVKDATG